MKRIYARISMELVVSDEEADRMVYECGSSYYKDSTTGQLMNNEFDLSDELTNRFYKEGTLACGSYVPEDCISDEKV